MLQSIMSKNLSIIYWTLVTTHSMYITALDDVDVKGSKDVTLEGGGYIQPTQ